jgi:prepilin-type processing-associated H-X9-DG protein
VKLENGSLADPFHEGTDTKWFFVGGGRVSYGINGRVNKFSQDSHKIFMVEYCKLVADVVGTSAPDLTSVTDTMRNSPDWTGWGGGRARHAGGINALFGDGHVETLNPLTINPSVATIHDEYWKPQSARRRDALLLLLTAARPRAARFPDRYFSRV